MDEKMKKYFELAYPGESATPQAKKFFKENYSVIYKQIALAEFESRMGTSTRGKVDGEMIKGIVRNVKVDNYFKLAYGDKENATSADRDFISENLGAIEATYRKRMQVNISNNRNMTEEEVLQEAIKLVKIKEYSKLALKGRETSFDEKKKIEKFISANFERINRTFEQSRGVTTKGKTDEEIILGAMHDIKVDEYFELAYGDGDKATGNDRIFISQNIDKLETYYEEYRRQQDESQEKGKSDQEIFLEVIKKAKAERFFEIAHPENFETLSEDEQKKWQEDKEIIFANIYEIYEKYKDQIGSSGRAPFVLPYLEKDGGGFDNKKIILNLVENISTRTPNIPKKGKMEKDEKKENNCEGKSEQKVTEGDYKKFYEDTKHNLKGSVPKIKEALAKEENANEKDVDGPDDHDAK